MKCPHCGADTPSDEWNCVSCRINLYWASQHHDGLADIRARQGLGEDVPTPAFLVKVHKQVMDDRAARGQNVDNKVRVAARRAMRER